MLFLGAYEMWNEARIVLMLLLLTMPIGVAYTLLSALRVSDFQDLHPSYMLPCVLRIFRVPVNVTKYGFPLSWIICVDGIEIVGCGPVVGAFSQYSFCFIVFLLDTVVYTSIFFPFMLLKYFTIKARSNKLE